MLRRRQPVIVLGVLLLLCSTSIARTRKAYVPLMAPPAKRLAANTEPRKVVYEEYREERHTRSQFSLGGELGLLGRPDSTNGKILGLTTGLLGRVFAEYAASSRFILRGSLGYFANSSGEAQVLVSQSNLELGLAGYYRFPSRHSTKFDLGLAQRLIRTTSTITVFGTPTDNPSSLAYRLGPAASAEFGMTQTFSLLLNSEVTFQIASPMRTFVGLTAGLLFHLH